MLKVTGCSVKTVLDYLEGVDDAFELFEGWLNNKGFRSDEQTYVRFIFDTLLGMSFPYSVALKARAIEKSLGNERAKALRAMVQAFVVENELETEEEIEENAA